MKTKNTHNYTLTHSVKENKKPTALKTVCNVCNCDHTGRAERPVDVGTTNLRHRSNIPEPLPKGNHELIIHKSHPKDIGSSTVLSDEEV